MTPASPSGLGIVVPARNRPIHLGCNMLEYGFPEYGPCLQATVDAKLTKTHVH